MLPVASRFVLRPRFFIFLPLPSSSLTWEWWGIQVLLRLASESLFRSISYQIWSSFPSDRASSTPFIDGRPKAQSVHWFIGVASFWQGFFSHFFHRYSSSIGFPMQNITIFGERSTHMPGCRVWRRRRMVTMVNFHLKKWGLFMIELMWIERSLSMFIMGHGIF